MRHFLTCIAALCFLVGCSKDFSDLSVGMITATPVNPQPGDTVTISVPVTNYGNAGATTCTWSVNRDGIQGFTSGSLPALVHAESTTISFPVTEIEASSHTYQVIVNYDNVVSESNYADNSTAIVVTWALPIDLQASPLTIDPAVPTSSLPVTLNTTVTNAATVLGTATAVSWSVTRDGVARYVVGVLPTLAPGASIVVPVTLPAQSAGPHIYDFIIDPDGKSTDRDRTNNTQSLSVTVLPTSG